MAGFNFFGMNDKGLVREFNEDAFTGFVHKNVLFLIVADGMGGKEGLNMASAVAVNEMTRHIERSVEMDNSEHLKKVVSDGLYWVNRVLLAYPKANDAFNGNITTLTVCAINANKDIVIGHAGNSRLYLLRNGMLAQMTKDHTEAQKLLEQGKITKEEARTHPDRWRLTRALGAAEDMPCDVFGGKLAGNDIVLLCSDGVFGMLSDPEIQQILAESGESKKACEWLIEGANKRGGVDNIAVLMSFVGF